MLRPLARQLHQLTIACQIGNAQIEQPALLGTIQIARPPQPQVGFGDFKTIVGAYHGLYTLAAVLTEFETRQKDTE